MNKERDDLKGIMSQFVDLLIDAEVTELRNELAKAQDIMNSQILDLKRLVVTEIKTVKETLNRELHTIRTSSSEKQVSAQEVAQKEATIYKHLQSLASKMSKALKEHESRQNSKLSTLEERVHQNEETLFITRDDHENLSILLKRFATGLTELSSSDSEVLLHTEPASNNNEELNRDFQPNPSLTPQPHQLVQQPLPTLSN